MEIRRIYKTELPLKAKANTKSKAKANKTPFKQPKELFIDHEPVKKLKKIKKQTQNRNDKRKVEKKIEREERSKGKLLDQLLLIHQRIERMDKDNERYCLVDWKKEQGKRIYRFSIMRQNEPFVLKIDVKPDYNTVCNCMDWRIRCRNQMIPCKHIYYLLQKILGYELYDYFDNQIMMPDIFEQLIKAKLEAKKVHMDKSDDLKDKECPICFAGFDGYEAGLVKKCPECRCCAHDDCARLWLLHSVRKTCAICGSNNWKIIIN